MTSVSVVIPTVGRTDRLKRALRSVTTQTRTPEEIIVVSKHDKSDINDSIQEFDAPITIIKQNGDGLANARNEGIDASSESLIAFLDDDDWWKPEKIRRQVQAIHNTDAAFVFTGIQHVDANGNTINFRIPTNEPGKKEMLTHNAVGAPSTVLAKRSCLDAVGGFDENLLSREEWDLYIRLLEKFECTYISDPLIVKESHDESISRDIDMIERDWMALFEKHESKYDEHSKQMFFSNYHFELGRMSCKEGDLRRGRENFKKSIMYSRKPTRFPHYLSTFFGERIYKLLTSVYRKFQRIRKRVKYYRESDSTPKT